MKYTGEFYNEGADKTNKKPIEVKEEIMKKANNNKMSGNNNVKNAKNAQNNNSQNGRNCGKQSPENCD